MKMQRTEFGKLTVGEEFVDIEQGDVWIKMSDTDADCERAISGANEEGDTKLFQPTAPVERKRK